MNSTGRAAATSPDVLAAAVPDLRREDAPRTALLLGATGLVGSHCLDLLLSDPLYQRVLVLGRSPIDRTHPRLTHRVADLGRLGEHRDCFAVEDVYCCLGTTIRRAGSREAFRTVDVDYPAQAARLAEDASVQRFLVVSAVGADPESSVFYNRMKGEMEAAVRATAIPAIWIFRPSLLLGKRGETRPLEKLGTLLMRPVGPLMAGPLRRYRPVHARTVALAMIAAAHSRRHGGIVEPVAPDSIPAD